MTGTLAPLFVKDQQLSVTAHDDLVTILVLDKIGVLQLDAAADCSFDI